MVPLVSGQPLTGVHLDGGGADFTTRSVGGYQFFTNMYFMHSIEPADSTCVTCQQYLRHLPMLPAGARSLPLPPPTPLDYLQAAHTREGMMTGARALS